MATPRVLILRAPGANCDAEAQFAFELAGAEAERVHINRLREQPGLLQRYQILVVPGGFTYGDDVAAGKILANQLRHFLGDALRVFRDAEKLILGICNGFQALLKAGLLVMPDEEGPLVTLAPNASGKFEDRWIVLQATPGRCPFLAGYDRLHVPVAHGEGRLICREPWMLQGLREAGQVVLRYTRPDGGPPVYPDNPNGSQEDVAGLCDVSGRVLGLMPHPERHVLPTQHPRWTREGLAPEGAGLRLFRNAVQFFAQGAAMHSFTDVEKRVCAHLIDLALQEDLQSAGDLTCAAVIPSDLQGQAVFVARSEGVVAGLPVAGLVYAAHSVDGEKLTFETLLEEGTPLKPGTALARVSGSMATILSTERVILNFLQRLSGVASLTHRYVVLVADLPCRILDTRKTTPGWRLLEKYAVRCGGGHNHRMGLYDGVMLKDNHLAVLARSGQGQGTIAEAVRAVRQKYAATVPLEVEVDTLEQLDEALASKPDVVLLDNMSLDNLREAVRRRTLNAPGVLLEASGGVNLTSVRGIAETGVNRISVGALTHSASALDIGLDYQT